MSPARLAKKVFALARAHPLGQVLYHRASGERCIVMGYHVDAHGCAMLDCDYGKFSEREFPLGLVAKKPSLEDGEEWKNDEPEGAGK